MHCAISIKICNFTQIFCTYSYFQLAEHFPFFVGFTCRGKSFTITSLFFSFFFSTAFLDELAKVFFTVSLVPDVLR